MNGDNRRDKWRSGKLGVLAELNFRRFYIGYATSLLGTAMSSTAIAFAVLDSGATPTALGVVLTANIVPMIVFMLGGGVLGFGGTWAAFGTLAVLAVPAVRTVTWESGGGESPRVRSGES